jgi:hypothetical protein
MKIYVVMENDRGAGVWVVATFTNKENAEEFCKTSSHYFMDESELDAEVSK